MQQLMQEFYSQKDKKPHVPRLGKKKTNIKEPSLPTFTVEEMMKTVNTHEHMVNPEYDFRSTIEKKKDKGQTSGTGGQRNKKTNKYSGGYGKGRISSYGTANKRPEKVKKFNGKGKANGNKGQTENTNNKRKSTVKDPEFLMMMSDINDYKNKVSNNDDLDRFEEFLNEENEERREKETYGDDIYLTDNKPDLKNMDMKEAIKYMTREERAEYLAEKKKRKKLKREEELAKQMSFKPKINPKSKMIDNNRTRHMKIDRNQLLFGLNTVLKHREEQLKEIVEAEKFMKYAQEELNECTFHPKINRGGPVSVHEGSIAQRTKAFMNKKRLKEEQHKRLTEMNEVRHCTFAPRINPTKSRKSQQEQSD